MVRQFAASQIDTQKTAFMRWVNVQLAKTTAYVPMATIEKDLRDGKRLIGLLEVIWNEPLKPERGNMRIHQMANVSKALSFLEKKTDEPLGSIGNEDIVDGNVKLTLGLIWIIIYRFQIQHVANTMTEFYPSLLEELNQVNCPDFFFFLSHADFAPCSMFPCAICCLCRKKRHGVCLLVCFLHPGNSTNDALFREGANMVVG